MCGCSCDLVCSDGVTVDQRAGLRAHISGGYHSTPGNGDGALDDGNVYRFALCEFCLDWLFSQFTTPVSVTGYDGHPEEDSWRPAVERVTTDDLRRDKERFFAEWGRRNRLRNAKKS